MQIQAIDEVFAILDDEESPNITNWLGTLGTTGAAATSVLSTENSARSGRNSANTTTLNNLKATLKTERETKEAAADRLYRNTEQSAWNSYLTSVQSANTVYLGSIKTAENTYKTASDAAESTFDTTTITAYTNYHQSVHALDTAFYAAIADADDANFTTTAYFTTSANTTLPYQKTTFAKNENALDTEQEESTQWCWPWDPNASWNPIDNVCAHYKNYTCMKRLAGNIFKKQMNTQIEFLEAQAQKTGVPVIASGTTFVLRAEQNSMNLVVDTFSQTGLDLAIDLVNDIDQSVEVGKEHGLRVGVARQIGLLQFAEAGYGVDVMTLQPVDPWSKTAEGSGRFGATSGAIGGVVRGVPSVLEWAKSHRKIANFAPATDVIGGTETSAATLSTPHQQIVKMAETDMRSMSANNANASGVLGKKLRELQYVQEGAANGAIRARILPDGRIRYYRPEKPASTLGRTRGTAYVSEYDPSTGTFRSWMESYDHSGNVIRVHPKMKNGFDLNSLHYPPTGKELK